MMLMKREAQAGPFYRLGCNTTALLSYIWWKHIFQQNLFSLEAFWCCRESYFSWQRAKAASHISIWHTTAVSAARHYKTCSISGLFAETLCMTNLWAITSFPREKLHSVQQITGLCLGIKCSRWNMSWGWEVRRHQQWRKGHRHNILHHLALHYLPDLLQRALQQSYSVLIKIRCNSRSFSQKVRGKPHSKEFCSTNLPCFYPWSKSYRFQLRRQKGVGEGNCGGETQGTLGGGEWAQEPWFPRGE